MSEHRIIFIATIVKDGTKTFDISFKDKQGQYIIDEYGVKVWYKPYILMELDLEEEANDE